LSWRTGRSRSRLLRRFRETSRYWAEVEVNHTLPMQIVQCIGNLGADRCNFIRRQRRFIKRGRSDSPAICSMTIYGLLVKSPAATKRGTCTPQSLGMIICSLQSRQWQSDRPLSPKRDFHQQRQRRRSIAIGLRDAPEQRHSAFAASFFEAEAVDDHARFGAQSGGHGRYIPIPTLCRT